MYEENDFLRKLLENPPDDTARLVYADWLDERGDAWDGEKSLYLRITVRLRSPGRKPSDEGVLSILANTLDEAWLAVVSRLKVESCPTARNRLTPEELRAQSGLRFSVVCDKQWDEMTPTDEPGVRRCRACDRDVHYCGTIMEARKQVWAGNCVAVHLGMERRDGDLEPPGTVVGGSGII